MSDNINQKLDFPDYCIIGLCLTVLLLTVVLAIYSSEIDSGQLDGKTNISAEK